MDMNRSSPLDGLDREAALARVGGDIDLLKDIARVFLDDCPRALAELRKAGTNNDCVLAEQAAHSLKGAASNFGAGRVVETSLHIEKMGRAGKLDGFESAVESLESALALLRSELEALLKTS